MAEFQTASLTSDGPAAAIRRELDQVLARISRTRTAIAAFKLAAEADRDTPPEIYWPDLMKVLHDLLPDEADLSDRFRELFEKLHATGDSALEPAA